MPTCRAKAQAVLDGKASVTMCLPFFREKAESLSLDQHRGSPVFDILEADIYARILSGSKNILAEKVHYESLGLIVKESIDLVTEGIITLGTAAEYIKWSLSNHTVSAFENAEKPVGGATGFEEKRLDGAAALAKLLMNECTQINCH